MISVTNIFKKYLAQLFFVAMFLCISPSAFADEYKLGAGDKLRITVHEWPDLTGQFSVSAERTVFMPLIGEVDARNATVRTLAKRISSQLRSKIRSELPPQCSIEIIEYRPFFVVGDVAHPGKYDFRPGLTVLQAVSIAGGFYRETNGRDFFSIESDFRVAKRRAKEIAARIARLQAEQLNATTIEFPQHINWDSPSDQAIQDGERKIFRSNNEALEKQLATFDRYLSLQQEQINTIDTQIATGEKHLTKVKHLFEGFDELAKKGLSNNARQAASTQTIAQLESNVYNLLATKLRVQQSLSEIEQRRLTALNLRSSRINGELQAARSSAAENTYRLRASQQLMSEGSVGKSYELSQKMVRFEIQREVDGSEDKIAAEATTKVLPGDVVIVSRILSTPLNDILPVEGQPKQSHTAPAQDKEDARVKSDKQRRADSSKTGEPLSNRRKIRKD